MATNRDYTGLVRTPSSMAWLIRERARIKGRIEHLQKLADEIPLELAELSHRLQSLDAVFPLHEVEVDPSVIKGVKKYAKKILPHGSITSGIYECLRENLGNGPLYTSEISLFIARTNNLDIGSVGKIYLIRRVSRRLQTLAAQGEIVRHHATLSGSNDEGRWSLPAETE